MDLLIIFFIFSSFLFNEILSIDFLKKYSSVKVSCPTKKKMVFDSSEFNLNEDMFFTFKLNAKGLDGRIYYSFYENINIEDNNSINDKYGSTPKDPTSSMTTKTNNVVKSETKYYKIKKDIENIFLLLQFYCDRGTLTIENTKEDKGKQNQIIIIVVICVVFVIGFIITIVCCIRRRKARIARAAAMQASGMTYYANPAVGVGMSMGMAPGYGIIII